VGRVAEEDLATLEPPKHYLKQPETWKFYTGEKTLNEMERSNQGRVAWYIGPGKRTCTRAT
jgi:hypothetical protein